MLDATTSTDYGLRLGLSSICRSHIDVRVGYEDALDALERLARGGVRDDDGLGLFTRPKQHVRTA